MDIHWPKRQGKDARGHTYFACKFCKVVMVFR